MVHFHCHIKSQDVYKRQVLCWLCVSVVLIICRMNKISNIKESCSCLKVKVLWKWYRHFLHENKISSRKLYFGQMSSHHKLHVKHCTYLRYVHNISHACDQNHDPGWIYWMNEFVWIFLVLVEICTNTILWTAAYSRVCNMKPKCLISNDAYYSISPSVL